MSRRKWLTIGVVFVLAACAAPFLPLTFLRPRVENALSGKLGRRVEVGDVSFTLFTGPGLALSNVIIHEDPRAGIEPFVYAQTADARLDLAALLQGRRGFSSLRLVDATLNLVRTPNGDWNFQYLNAARLEDAPTLHLRNTRVNLKLGDTKSVFYFDGSDLDVSPGNQGSVALRFSGIPGRTDNPAQNFGQLVVRGSWAPAAAAQPLSLSVELEPSSFDGVAKLFGRTWFDMQGQVSLTAQMSGLPSQMAVAGEAQLDEGRRSDFLPNPDAKWKLPFRGTLDLEAETLHLENVPDSKSDAPISAHLRANHLVTSPQWSADAALQDEPLAVILEAAHRVGAPLPEKLTGTGMLSGTLQYDSDTGLSGAWEARDAAIRLADTPAMKAEMLPIKVAAATISAGPVTLSLSDMQNAQVEVSYKFDGSSAIDAKFTTRGVSLATLRPFAAAPLLEHVVFVSKATDSKAPQQKVVDPKTADPKTADPKTNSLPVKNIEDSELSTNAGMWRGTIRFQGTAAEGVWTGDYSVENAQLSVDGIADPIHLHTAAVTASPGRFAVTRIKGSVGNVSFTGETHWAAKTDSATTDAAPRVGAFTTLPYTFKLQIPEASAVELQRLFRPTLVRSAGILQRAKSLGSNPSRPDWISQRKVEGSVSIAFLLMDDDTFVVDIPRIAWDGTTLLFSPFRMHSLSASASFANLSGDLTMNISAAAVLYRLTGKLAGFPYRGGRVDFDGSVEASGDKPLGSLHAEGTLNGRAIAFSRDAIFRTAKAQFETTVQGSTPRWKFTDVEVTRGNEVYRGEGVSQPDGKLVLDLQNLGKPVQFTGTLANATAAP